LAVPNTKNDDANPSEDPEQIKIKLESNDKKLKKGKKSLEVDLVRITDGIIRGDPNAKDELKLHIKKLKTEIREKSDQDRFEFKHIVELGKDLDAMSSELGAIDKVVAQISKAFEGKTWLAEIQRLIDGELFAKSGRRSTNGLRVETKLNEVKTAKSAHQNKLEESRRKLEVENKLFGVTQSTENIKTLVLALKEAGTKALRERSFDKAIDILKETENKVIPIIAEAELISVDEGRNLKLTILDELKEALIQKGQIDDAIKVIDSQFHAPKYKNEKYQHSQLKKCHLLVQTGEFSKGIKLLNKLLDNCCDDRIEYATSAEIKRALGMAYRGRGFYDDALIYFQQSQVEFKKANDSKGYHNALWGQGILHYLRGEWDEALSIWQELQTFFTERKPKYLFKIYFEYMRTFKLSGNFQEAENMLVKALKIIPSEETEGQTKSKISIHLAYAELYYLQNKLEDARQSIEQVRSLTTEVKDASFELSILEVEIDILCALDNHSEARKKLKRVYNLCKSNWDFVKYYRLLGKTEKYEMNYGEAQKALKSAISLMEEIGAISYPGELALTELLIEMSKLGNTKAYEQAQSLLKKIENEIFEKNLPTLQLELKLQKGYLSWSQSRYEDAYYIFSEIVEEADVHRMFRQKTKALEALNTLEQQGQNLKTSTTNRSVFRYLDDARRILEEYS
jgi:tetratricopeptide (TPR) repeat protein